MTTEFDSNKIPSREEREERVLDLHFNQNKNYRQIAKQMKMSVRDIGEKGDGKIQYVLDSSHYDMILLTYLS